MKKKLFPTLKGPMSTVACKLPDDFISHVDKVANRQMRTRSDILRVIIIDSLRAQGIVATVEEMEAEADKNAA